MSERTNPLEDFEPDEAEELWGGGPAQVMLGKRAHIPFYKFTLYADRLDLRNCGYELEKFGPLFDRLDAATTNQARKIHRLLHLPSGTSERFRGGNKIWTPRRAREIEFRVIEALHGFGLSDMPILLRRVSGNAFPDGTVSHLSVDVLDVFYWSALAQVARDFIWRDERLEFFAEYLEYPVRRVFGYSAVEAAA